MPINQATQTGSNTARQALGFDQGYQQGDPGGIDPVNQQQMQLQQMQSQQRQTMGAGLPRGGLDSQLDSINQYYDQVRNATIELPSSSSLSGKNPTKTYNIGFDPQAYQANQLGGVGQETAVGDRQGGYSTDLNSLARRLATSYGLDIGRGDIVDASGNLLITPDQIQAASGGAETVGSAAAKLNYMSAAITKEQNLQQQQKGIAAIQTSLGQVQKRGRGSLAAMQTGLYQDLADLYSNQEYKAADYSYFIERERMDLARELDKRARDTSKGKARSQFWGGLVVGAAGLFTGNYAVAAQGASMSAQSYEGTGYNDRWF